MIAALATWAGVGAVLAAFVAGLALATARVLPGGLRPALLLPVGFSATVVVGALAAALHLHAAVPLVLLGLAAAWGALGPASATARVAGSGSADAPSRGPQGTRREPATRIRRRLAAVRTALGSAELRWGAAALATIWLVLTLVVAGTGQMTYGGYGLIGDPVIHLVGADSLLGGGGAWAGEPGSYRAFFDGYYGTGYPTGGASVLALADALVGLDPVAVLHPVLVLAMVVFGSAVWVLLAPIVERAWLRAVLTVLASMPSLTFAFVLMSSLKEVVTIAVVASSAAACSVLWRSPANRPDGCSTAPAYADAVRIGLVVGLGPAAAIAAIGPAGVVYVAPIFVVVVVALLRTRGAAVASRLAVAALAAVVLLSLPSLLSLRSYLDVSGTVLTTQSELGNLKAGPLPVREVLGVWIGPDFRIAPTFGTVTWVAQLLVLGLGLLGVAACAQAVRRGRSAAVGLVAWLLASALAAVVVIRVGSPWADAKALAIAAPAVTVAAGIGVSTLMGLRRTRWIGGAVGLVVAAGVAGSAASIAYELGTAPQARLDELARIDDRFAGQGPMITAEFEETVRHTLRKVPATFGADSYTDQVYTGRFGFSGDQDDLGTVEVQHSRLVLVRTGPGASRPPSNFARVWRGRFYEVWRRDDRMAMPREHRGIGDVLQNGQAIPSCRWITEVASLAQAGERMAVASRAPVDTQILAELPVPSGWRRDVDDPRTLNPVGSGQLAFTLQAGAPNALVDLWFEGSFSRRASIVANGQRGALGPSELNPRASATRVMSVRADASGAVRVELERPGRALRPAWGNGPEVWGPVSITAVDPLGRARVQTLDPREARSLCGRPLDWIELLHAK